MYSVNQVKQEKQQENDLIMIEIQNQSESLMKPSKKIINRIIQKQSKKIKRFRPIDLFFLKILLPKKKTQNTEKKLLPEMEISLTDNLYIDKYFLDIKGQKLRTLTDLTSTKNDFTPRTLTHKKGSSFVKNRIENEVSEEMLWGLTNVNTIGKILGTVEDKIKVKLDKGRHNGGIPLGGANFLDEITNDKEYLSHFEKLWAKKLEEEVMGKKFKEKFEYVENFISKRKASEFVDYINIKQKSKSGKFSINFFRIWYFHWEGQERESQGETNQNRAR